MWLAEARPHFGRGETRRSELAGHSTLEVCSPDNMEAWACGIAEGCSEDCQIIYEKK